MPFCGYFSPRDPGETRAFSINFAQDINASDTIASVTVTLAADIGFTDSNAPNLCVGLPTITGAIVSQMIGGPNPTGFQAGVTYLLTMTAITAAGETVSEQARIQINTPV